MHSSPSLCNAHSARRRWYQFSLAGVMIAVTIMATWLGYLVHGVHEQREALAVLERLDTKILFRHELKSQSKRSEPPGPAWLRAVIGDDYFRTPVEIHVNAGATDEVMAKLPKLPALQEIIVSGDVSAEGLKRLSSLRQLGALGLTGNQFTDEDLRGLAELDQVRGLTIACPQVTNEGLAHLQEMQHLVLLRLYGSFSDAGMKHLHSAKQLRRLICVTRSFNDQHQLHGPIGVTFKDVPLPDCLEILTNSSRLKFRIDKDAIRAAGIDLDALAITGNCQGDPLPIAMDKLLSPSGLGWTTDAEGVVIISAEAANEAKQGIHKLQQTLPKLKTVEVDW